MGKLVMDLLFEVLTLCKESHQLFRELLQGANSPWRRCHSSSDASGNSGKCFSSSPVGILHHGAA